MSYQLHDFDAHQITLRTRMPFRYGIATLTETPHLFFRVTLGMNGRRGSGVAADHLPPKWFTKDPNTTHEQDSDEMLRVIHHAADVAMALPPAQSIFGLWKQLYAAQAKWADERNVPPLLAHFGVSLVERAVIDAFCRMEHVTFAAVLWENRFGMEGVDLSLLPPAPLRTIIARHTVGLSDPLTDEEISPADRVDDGLPQSLEACIRAYGLSHFKIKLSGDIAKDIARLRQLAEVIGGHVRDYAFTLDGNENFHDLAPFRALWQAVTKDASLAEFVSKLIFIEQPLHRDVALEDCVRHQMRAWGDRPPIIIDESDAAIESLGRALDCGYVGTSHKNCKGVFKGIMNACRIARLQREHPERGYLLSGEDLTNVPPVALMQDLAVMASLGIEHVERNGHHYFKGLSMLPAEMSAKVQSAHPDLFHPNERGFSTLALRGGKIAVGTIVDAPFGMGFDFNPYGDQIFRSSL